MKLRKTIFFLVIIGSLMSTHQVMAQGFYLDSTIRVMSDTDFFQARIRFNNPPDTILLGTAFAMRNPNPGQLGKQTLILCDTLASARVNSLFTSRVSRITLSDGGKALVISGGNPISLDVKLLCRDLGVSAPNPSTGNALRPLPFLYNIDSLNKYGCNQVKAFASGTPNQVEYTTPDTLIFEGDKAISKCEAVRIEVLKYLVKHHINSEGIDKIQFSNGFYMKGSCLNDSCDLLLLEPCEVGYEYNGVTYPIYKVNVALFNSNINYSSTMQQIYFLFRLTKI